MGAWRKASQEPAKERGREIRNQMMTRKSIVVKGTAPEEAFAHRKRFMMKKVAKTMPGTRTGVSTMVICHRSPPRDL